MMSLAVIAHAQTELHGFSSGEYAIGVELGFLEDLTALQGNLTYGISQNIAGFLLAGLGFPEDPEIPGVSMPPIQIFGVGLATSDRLGQTGLDYWSTVDVGIALGEFVEDTTDTTIMTSRATAIGVSVGLMKAITTESDLVFFPLAGISYAYTSGTSKSKLIDFSQSERDGSMSGQIGLTARISPKMTVGGTVVFSFEEPNISYYIGMSLCPQRVDTHVAADSIQSAP